MVDTSNRWAIVEYFNDTLVLFEPRFIIDFQNQPAITYTDAYYINREQELAWWHEMNAFDTQWGALLLRDGVTSYQLL